MALNSPLEIPGCQIWLDASDVTTLFQLSGGTVAVTASGDPVGYWGDKSGNNRHFTNNGGNNTSRPLFKTNSLNGKSTITFDGLAVNGDWLQHTLISPITFTSETLFVVFNLRTGNNSRILMQAQTGITDEGLPNFYIPLMNNGAVITSVSTYTNTGIGLSPVTLRSGNFYDIVTARHNGTSFQNFINGAGSTVTNHTLNYTVGNFRVSGRGTNPFGGDVAEVIVYDRALTDLERHNIEYYLAQKWNQPSYAYAIKTGNWSDTTTWSVSSLPLSGDEVYANTYTVNADQDTVVGSLRNAALSPNIAAGGTFTINQPVTITAVPNGFIADTATCITSFLSSGTAILSGNINAPAGNAAAGVYSIRHNSSGDLILYGNIVSNGGRNRAGLINNSNGNVTIYGGLTGSFIGGGQGAGPVECVRNASTGVVKVFGDITSGSIQDQGGGGFGIVNAGFGNVYVTGNLFGPAINTVNNSGNNTSNNAIVNSIGGAIVVNGNVYAGTMLGGATINNASNGPIIVNGDVYATFNGHGIISPNSLAINDITGSIFNSDGGRQAVFATRYQVRPKAFNSATFYKNTDLVNLLTRSEVLSSTASWTLFQTTLTPRASSTFLSNISAYKLIETTANTEHYLRQTILNTETTFPLIFSVYLKRAEARYVVLTVEGGSGTHGYSIVYDLSTNLPTATRVTNSGVVTLTGVQDVGDGWYRYTLGGTNTTTTKIVTIALSNRSDYSGTVPNNFYPAYFGGLSGVLVYGPQAEYRTQTDYVSTDTTQGYINRNQQPVTYYAPEAYHLSYLPETSSVKLGTGYAAISSLSGINVNIPVQLSGTMVVPSPFSVNYGVPVDDTVGVAVLDSKLIWDTDVNTLTANDVLGRRLKNTATVQDCGQELLNLNN